MAYEQKECRILIKLVNQVRIILFVFKPQNKWSNPSVNQISARAGGGMVGGCVSRQMMQNDIKKKLNNKIFVLTK